MADECGAQYRMQFGAVGAPLLAESPVPRPLSYGQRRESGIRAVVAFLPIYTIITESND
jgi:hypothetical protein